MMFSMPGHLNVNPRVTASPTGVGHVPHGVLEGPDDGVQDQLELGRRDGQECREAVGIDGLKQVEEMGPVLRELFEILFK